MECIYILRDSNDVVLGIASTLTEMWAYIIEKNPTYKVSVFKIGQKEYNVRPE